MCTRSMGFNININICGIHYKSIFYPSILLNSLTFLFSYVCAAAHGTFEFNLKRDQDEENIFSHVVYVDDKIIRAPLPLLLQSYICVCA